ncbi:MAG: hypothetical protein M1813_008389 [Trichoglossum hirsutum]|nr:MAG: hypothetical protein M1813_008389 [Trichoglossum hirsutum]
MSDSNKKSAYGQPASDTSFRKTWDKDEYAAKAATREEQEREEAKARFEAKSQGRLYHKPASSNSDSTPQTQTNARSSRLNISSQIGKTQLVPAGFSTGKRGRGAGFWCQDCDLTFKDNLQWVDHLNSKQHLVATGESGVVERVGVEAVRERLAMLARKMGEREGEGEGLRERLERRRVEEEREREEKREKRREKRRKGKSGGDDKGQREEEDVAGSMGFGHFGTTKA